MGPTSECRKATALGRIGLGFSVALTALVAGCSDGDDVFNAHRSQLQAKLDHLKAAVALARGLPSEAAVTDPPPLPRFAPDFSELESFGDALALEERQADRFLAGEEDVHRAFGAGEDEIKAAAAFLSGKRSLKKVSKSTAQSWFVNLGQLRFLAVILDPRAGQPEGMRQAEATSEGSVVIYDLSIVPPHQVGVPVKLIAARGHGMSGGHDAGELGTSGVNAIADAIRKQFPEARLPGVDRRDAGGP